MFKSISLFDSIAPGRLQRMLLLCFVCLMMFLTAGLLWGQEPPSLAPFDELNSRLGMAAERVLADNSVHVRNAMAKEPAKSPAIPAPIALPRQPTAKGPERRMQTSSRVQQLRPVIDPILRGEGIPPELVAVALIESGGQAAAISPKGARGVWQLMPDTARRYGLIVSGQKDDRLDLVSATRAAARYLHDLHAQFGDWELVLAAYNAGEQAVQSAIQRAGSNSFAVLSQLRLLPAETRNYVPAVMSARGLFTQQTTVIGETAPRNFSAGNVFYAMNGAEASGAAGSAQAPELISFTPESF